MTVRPSVEKVIWNIHIWLRAWTTLYFTKYGVKLKRNLTQRMGRMQSQGGILVGSDGLEYIFDNKSNWNYWSSSIENAAKRQSSKRNQQVSNAEEQDRVQRTIDGMINSKPTFATVLDIAHYILICSN